VYARRGAQNAESLNRLNIPTLTFLIFSVFHAVHTFFVQMATFKKHTPRERSKILFIM
jgi:hypothetical protein